MRRRLAMLLAVAVWMSTGLAGEGMAEPVTVRAATHDGYGRMVFNWETPVRHSAAIEGRTLTIQFARPLEGELAPIRKALARYVSDIRVLEDEQRVVATLRGDYQLRDFDLGAAVVIDLFDASPTPPMATPAGTPDATETADRETANATPVIPIRSGLHTRAIAASFSIGRVALATVSIPKMIRRPSLSIVRLKWMSRPCNGVRSVTFPESERISAIPDS